VVLKYSLTVGCQLDPSFQVKLTGPVDKPDSKVMALCEYLHVLYYQEVILNQPVGLLLVRSLWKRVSVLELPREQYGSIRDHIWVTVYYHTYDVPTMRDQLV
jgi:hypothetical protein